MVSQLGTDYVNEFIKKYNLKDKKVLNVGCGKDDYGYDNITNIDEMDWSRHTECPRNFFLVNAEKMPFENESFDAVLLIDMLEHCRHPYMVMSEISRVLKKDGLLCTINTFIYKMHGNEISELVYGDYWRFTSLGIKLLCRESNLKVIENTYYESYYNERLCYDALNSKEPNATIIRYPMWIKIHTIAQK